MDCWQKIVSANGVAESELDRWVETSRNWVLYSCSDFFVVNKPEGIAVQVCLACTCRCIRKPPS